mgnify:CR=1 FL=1
MERALAVEVLGGQIDPRKVVKHLLRVGIEAVSNPTRRDIFEFIVEKKEQMASFTEIKKAFPKLRNGSLAFHLQKLQEAHLIVRKVKYEEKAMTPDHHYCYYSPSSWGKIFWSILASFEQEAQKRFASELSHQVKVNNLTGRPAVLPTPP